MPIPLLKVPARIEDLRGDVTITSPAEGDTLRRSGSRWVNARRGGTFYPAVVGNGVTDDWAVIQADCDTADAGGGGLVKLPIGTFLITRPIRLGSNVTLKGKGPGSVITRPTSIIYALTGDVAATQQVIPLASTTGLAIGQAFSIWDDTSAAQYPTMGLITAINPGVSVTIDAPFITPYTVANHAKAGSVFSLIRNKPNTRYVRVVDLQLDQNAISGDPVGIFQFSTLEWILGQRCVVKGNLFVRSICDCYSDQAGDYVGAPLPPARSNNHVRFNWFIDSRRYAMHWGTSMDGALAEGNTVIGGQAAIFYCANILNTRAIANYVAGTTSWAFIGLDSRDKNNLIKGNTVVNCYGAVDFANSQFNDFLDNKIIDCYGPLAISGSTNSQDNKIAGNRLVAASPNSAAIAVSNAYRYQIANNSVYNFPVTAGMTGLSLSGCTDVTVSDLMIVVAETGCKITSTVNLQVSGLNVVSPSSGVGVQFIGSSNRDCILNGITLTGATITGVDAQQRVSINGLGNNGASDPSSAGNWNPVSGLQYNGIRVRYNTGAGEKIKTFYDGVGWIL